jgi:chromosome segregation ATPase
MAEGLRVKFKEGYDNPGTSYHRAQAEEEEEDELDEVSAYAMASEELSELDEDAEFELELDEDVEASNKAADGLAMQASKKREEAARVQQQSDKARAAAKAEQEKISKEKKENSAEQSQDTEKTPSGVYEEVELTEEELLELEESLKVDMDVVSDGYMGTTKRKERESKKIAYAKARGDKEVARREEAKKKLSDLQEALEYLGTKYVKEKDQKESLEKTNENLIKAISSLKEQLDKVNLSNAKLLYTNKVLSNVSLNERQKTQIVENITKAESVSEAKTIYETLQSTVQSVQEKTPKSLSEALNRGPSPFLTRSRQPASLDNVLSDRMKALAGIK